MLACTDGGAEDHLLRADGGGTLDLWGLLPATAYGCELRWRDEGGPVLWSGAFVTEPLPADLPTFVPSGAAEPSLLDQGYVLLTWWGPSPGGRPLVHALIVDVEGRIRWFLPLPEATRVGVAAEWTEAGLLLGGGDVIPPSLRDLGGRVLASAAPPEGEDQGWHHEAKRTPEGWLLGLQAVPLTDEATGFRVDVTDPTTGAIRWSLDSAPLADAGILPPPPPGDGDPYHANAASWEEDRWGEAVWISLRGARRILRVDRATGAVTAQLGPGLGVRLVDPGGAALPELDLFTVTHDPEIRGEHLLVFDNGGDRPQARESRVSRYRLLAEDALELEWSWTEPGWFEPSFGSVQTLPDGTVLLGSGHDADLPASGGRSRRAFVAQLDGPAGRVIRRLDLSTAEDGLYRARFVDGCAVFANRGVCPALSPR